MWAAMPHMCACGAPDCPFSAVPAFALLEQLEAFTPDTNSGNLASFTLVFTGDFDSADHGAFDRQFVQILKGAARTRIVIFRPDDNAYRCVGVIRPMHGDH